jgi:hypothetical protein
MFINTTYKHFREQLLWEKEKSLLPATQPLVEQIIQMERDKKQVQVLEEEINEIENTIFELNQEIETRKSLIKDYKQQSYRFTKNESNVLFIRKCPSENCRGFLNTQWKCGICDKWTCSQCNEIKGTSRDNLEHKCNEDNVATTRFLKADTKHCPTCATPIFKIEGCDQMFCTQCQTSFSWRTGRIETGPIHNPHYFEYMRTHRREVNRHPDDIQCGRLLDHELVLDLENTLITHSVDKNIIHNIAQIGANMIHVQQHELPRFMHMGMQTNEGLRVSYLRNYISEDEFKKILQRKDKDTQKKHEIYNVLHMFITCMTDIFYRIVHSHHVDEILSCIHEIDTLRIYVNQCMTTISNVFKCRKFAFTSNMILCNPDNFL